MSKQLEPRLTFVGQQHGYVMSCGFSPDGKSVVCGGEEGKIFTWDATTGTQKLNFAGQSGVMMSCSFSPDGKTILSGFADNSIRLWDALTGVEKVKLVGHKGSVRACAFSVDGKFIISGSYDGTLILWDVPTAKPITTMVVGDSSVWVWACAFSVDGKRVASGAKDIKLWEVPSGALQLSIAHAADVHACAFAPSGFFLVSAGGSTLTIWDTTTGVAKTTLSGHTDNVISCAYSPKGDFVVSGSVDYTTKVWDVETGYAIASFHLNERVNGFGLSQDGNSLVVCGNNATLKLWDLTGIVELKKFVPRQEFYGHCGYLMSCGFSPDGRFVVSGGEEGKIKVWDASTGVEKISFDGLSGVMSCAFSPDGKTIVAGLSDNTVRLWDTIKGVEKAILLGHTGAVRSCVFSFDGKFVVSGSCDGTVKLWDSESSKLILTTVGDSNKWIWSCAISPDNKYMASGSDSVKLWELPSGALKTTFPLDDNLSCAFSPCGKYLVSASSKTVKLLDVATGTEKATLLGHTDNVISCAYSPNSDYILSGSADNTIKVWDVETLRVVATFNHGKRVNGCAFSPDGDRLISCGDGASLKLWDLGAILQRNVELEFAKEVPPLDKLRVPAVILRNHYFTETPTVLFECVILRKLDLSGGSLKTFNVSEVPFPNLRHLDLHKNQLNQISFSEKAYPLLSFVDVTDNPFSTFPHSVFTLSKLNTLKVGGVSIPYERQWDKPMLQQWMTSRNFSENTCRQLIEAFHKADSSGDGFIEKDEIEVFCDLVRKVLLVFSHLILPVASCVNVRVVELSWLGLVEIPPCVQSFSRLTHLNVEGNNLTTLPLYLGSLAEIEEIQVNFNPSINTPPIEVVHQGSKGVAEYMQLLSKGDEKCLKTKLMVVGLGGVGKTSLLRALQKTNFASDQQSTDGIDIHNWKIDDIEFCTWDFAGQTIYYNTHQMFLSARAVYLVVWNVRLGIEHAGLDFWLYSIQAKAPKCPVLVVGTRIDEVPFNKALIPEAALKKSYPQIQGFYGVSCKNSIGIDEFREQLIKVASNEPYMGEMIPISYLLLERIIKKHDGPVVMNREQLFKLAAPAKLTEQQLEKALVFLNDTGVIFFSKECYLEDFIVLDPQWITKVLACVVTVQAQGDIARGVFYKKDIANIWKLYPKEFHEKLLFLTELFELAFELTPEKFIVPCMLPEDNPASLETMVSELDKKAKYSFRMYDADYMPAGIFNRLQVKMQQYITGEGYMWKSGVILKTKTHVALAEMKTGIKASIKITVQGENPKNLLDIFHNALQELLAQSFPGIRFKLHIPCGRCLAENEKESINNVATFAITMLRRFQEKGIGYVPCAYGHFNSLMDLLSALPPSLPAEYSAQQADLVSGISAIRTVLDQPHSNQIFVSFNPQNSTQVGTNINAGCVGSTDPMDVVSCLSQKYKVEHTTDSPQQSAAEAIQCCHLFIACVSDEYAADSGCVSEFLYSVKVLRKQFIVVIVGSTSNAWNSSQIGLVMAGELYIDMRREQKMGELSGRVARIMPGGNTASATPQVQTPPTDFDCFISYCWRNSTKEYGEKAVGCADPRQIAAELKKKNLKVWLDVEELGVQGLFSDIAKGLHSTKVVVACISEEYAKSDNCTMELRHAAKNLKKPVIVCVVGASGPLKWAHTEVGMLAADYTYLNMGNTVEYGVNLERLHEEIQKKLLLLLQEKPAGGDKTQPTTNKTTAGSLEKEINSIQDKIEELQRGFLARVSSVHQETSTFPRVLSLWWRNQEKPVGSQIRFLCEHPGAWHFVEAQRIFDINANHFVDSVSCYLYPLAEILLQSSVCDPSVYLREKAGYQQGHEHMRDAITKLKEYVKEVLMLQKVTSVEEIEKAVNLKRVVLPTGEVLWLCGVHAQQKK